MMDGQYYGGGGFAGTQQMAQPYQGGGSMGGYGNDEGNYVCGGFDHGKAEANRAFPSFQGGNIREDVDRVFASQMSYDKWRRPGQYSQTEGGARSGQAVRGEGQGEMRQGGGEWKGSCGNSGLYTAEDHSAMAKRKGGVNSSRIQKA